MIEIPAGAFGADGRWDVPSEGVLARLMAEGAPFAHSATPPARQRLVEIYLDSEDHALQAAGVSCILRTTETTRHQLHVANVVERAGEMLLDEVTSDVLSPMDERYVRGDNRAVRRLRRLVDVTTLRPQLQLQVDRQTRVATSTGWWKRATFGFAYDTVTLRSAGLSASFHEVGLHEIERGRPSAECVATALCDHYALRAVVLDRRHRAEQLQAAMEQEAMARRVGIGRAVTLLAIDQDRVAAVRDVMGWRLPMLEGSGETACRHLMRRVLGTGVGDLHLVSHADVHAADRDVEIWCCTRMDRNHRQVTTGAMAWLTIDEMLGHLARCEGIDRTTLAALAAVQRSGALAHFVTGTPADRVSTKAPRRGTPTSAVRQLDPDLSLLRFNERVLSLAADSTTPLSERLRYLAIVASNLDEFFSVRVGRLKYRAGGEPDESDGSPAARRLERIGREARALVGRLSGLADTVLSDVAVHGVALKRTEDLSATVLAWLQEHFRVAILPVLTPRHLGTTDGHAMPLIPDRTLALAVVVRDRRGASARMAQVALPTSVPRFIALPENSGYVALDDVVRRYLALVFPGCRVEEASLFRLTRYADLAIDDGSDVDGVQVMDEQARLRERQPVVRIEVEQGTSARVRQLLLKELSFEPGARPGALRARDIVDVPGLLDLSSLKLLANAAPPDLSFAPMRARDALGGVADLWEAMRAGDVFLHHPYDDFAASVVRFVNEAADDPDVLSMKMTLYRTGDGSPIADALCRAAERGKDVTVFVELKARFDEARNVQWTRRLQASGVHVIHGIPGYKNHAKVAVVVRHEEGVLRRYAHIGTGNYNAGTARAYTDYGLLTSRADVCDDLASLFNTLSSGGSLAKVAFRTCLVAPHGLHRGLLERIRREADHARGGRPAWIRMKLNGLADREVIRALYDASNAGVRIALVVRGICTLQPGIPGLSERITVASIVGRFLEHARCYAFGNDGCPEWWIGSADLRPRNLHRRIEVLVPVGAPHQHAYLHDCFEAELADATAWRLGRDGTYGAPTAATFGTTVSAQRRLMAWEHSTDRMTR